ncbi:MAG: hypothetical protein H0U57_06055 [Tatlockia sp.]|nr:hypothetical protein [Tatlockia sp.]
MKPFLNATLPLLFAGFLIPAVSFAAITPDLHEIARECERSARNIKEFAQQSKAHNCSGEVFIASSHVHVAAGQIEHQKIHYAQLSLNEAKMELEKVRANPERCSYLAPKVAPFIGDLVRLKGDLTLIERVALKNLLIKD